MLGKIEFSDLYKFLTSIGFLAIVLAFLLPWLFMNQDNALIISDLDYKQLTRDSQELIDRKIQLNLRIVQFLPWISGFFLALGILLSFIGIRKWKEKQEIVDETDSYNLIILKSKRLSDKDIDNKREREVKEELDNQDDPEDNIQEKDLPKTANEIEALKENLSNIEKIFFDKIEGFNTFRFDPLYNVKIDDKFVVDILLRATNPNKYHDRFIEIKYIQTRLNMDFVRKSFRSTLKMMEHIHKKTSKKHKFYLIMVYKSDLANSQEVQRFRRAVTEYLSQFKTPYLKVSIINDKQAHDYNISELLN